jgi:hypothetical protein
MHVHELRQLDLRTIAIRSTGFLAATVLILGCGIESAFARCGMPVRGAVWKYGTTADLISWDGRWWADDQKPSSIQSETHSDPDSRPCSRCGGRPVDDRPLEPVGEVTRSNGQIGTVSCALTLIERSTPPASDLDLSDQRVLGRSLEVAKRPPRKIISI